MSAPNTVTLQNNSGDNFSGVIIFHASGTFVAPLPANLNVVLEVNAPINNGDTSPSGTATVADGLSDWWFGAVMNASNNEIYYISSTSFGDIPFKECGSPDNGSTIFEIGPYSGEGYEVTIQTNNSDGSSDGSCSAVAANETEIGESWAAFAAIVGEELLELIVEALEAAASPEILPQNNSYKVSYSGNSMITITTTTKVELEPVNAS